MFERFTDRARRVVVLAQEEARLLDHNYIGTEHLLLGLVHEDGGVAAKALEQLGISLGAVRREVQEMIGAGGSSPSGHIPFTPRAKKVLELSLREALQLGHNYIGTEHILLGLLREGQGVAAQVLKRLGADLSRVRQQVIQLLSGSGRSTEEYQAGTGTTNRHLRLRVSPGRLELAVDDPALDDLPEFDLVLRADAFPPGDSRAIFVTVRDIVRHLDARLAELESTVAFEPDDDSPADQDPAAPEPGG